jgi:hypothetical protein
MADHLAQVLHCLIESVACPMEDSAETDSRGRYKAAFDDVIMTRVSALQQNQMRSGINV